MCKIVFTLLFMASAITSASAEPKRDFRGFHPGMPRSEAESKLMELCIATPNDWPLSSDASSACDLGDAGISMRYTKALEPNRVYMVEFTIQSERNRDEMYDLVQSQYGGSMVAGEAVLLPMFWMILSGIDSRHLDLGDGISLWESTGDTSITTWFNKYSYRSGSHSYVIFDPYLLRSDLKAAKAQDEERRLRDPIPRF